MSVRQYGAGSVAAFSNASGYQSLFISSTGLVGIGTANPGAKVSIVTSGDAVMSPIGWDSTYVTIGLGGSSTDSGVGLGYNATSNYGILHSYTPASAWRDMRYKCNSHTFYTGVNGSTTSATITSTGTTLAGTTIIQGSVGIGTASPGAPLVVVNSAASPGNPGVVQFLAPNLASGSGVRISLGQGGGSSSAVAGDGAYLDYTNFSSIGASKNTFSIGFTQGATNILFVQSSGNVGIGTTNPVTTLDVRGGYQQIGGNMSVTNNLPSAAGSIFLYNDTVNGIGFFLNGASRSVDGGAGTGTLRNDNGDLRVQAAGGYNNALGITIKGTSGSVGIGTANPLVPLHVYSSGGANFYLDGTGIGGTTGTLEFRKAGTQVADIVVTNTAASWSTDSYVNDLVIRTQSSNVLFNVNGGSGASAMKIVSGSYVGIGPSVPVRTLHVSAPKDATSGWGPCVIDCTTTSGFTDSVLLVRSQQAQGTGFNLATFQATTTFIGSDTRALIRGDGTYQSTALAGTGNRALYTDPSGYITTTASDQRLKTNVVASAYGLDVVSKLNPVTFNWVDPTNRGDQRELGFIAQEVQSLVPEVIGTNNDGMLSLDYSKLVSVLTKAVQELSAKNTSLESRLAAIEAKLNSQ